MRWRPFGVATLVALLAAAVSVAAIPAGVGREPKIKAVRAQADAYVTAVNRQANFGKARRLRVTSQPAAHTYLKFKLENSAGEVRRVSLLLFSRTASRRGYKVHLASDRWRERRLSYSNAPRIFGRSISSGALRARAWRAVDVSSLVDWDGDEKMISLALTATGSGAVELASRESGLTGPRLVIELKDDENGSTKSTTQPPPPPTP